MASEVGKWCQSKLIPKLLPTLLLNGQSDTKLLERKAVDSISMRQNVPHLKPTGRKMHQSLPNPFASIMVQAQFVFLKGSDAGDLVFSVAVLGGTGDL